MSDDVIDLTVPAKKKVYTKQNPQRADVLLANTLDNEEYDDESPTRLPKSLVRRHRSDAQPSRRQDTEPAEALVPAGVVRAGTLNREKSTRSVTQHPMRDQHQIYRVRPSSKLGNAPGQQGKYHWSVYIGLGMLAMLLIWFLGTLLLTWWNQTWESKVADPGKYGTLHGTWTQMVIGNGDEKSPSIIQSYNHNGVLGVVVLFSNDPTKMQSIPLPSVSVADIEHADVNLVVSYNAQLHTNEVDVTILGGWVNGQRQQVMVILYPDGKGSLTSNKPKAK